MFKVVVLLLLYLFPFINGDKQCPSDRKGNENFEAQLLNDLFCDYDNSYRPVNDHRQSVNATVNFALNYLSFDAKEEKLNVQSWVTMTWYDAFLKWIPSNYGGLESLEIESYRIWTPRISLHTDDQYESADFSTTCLVNNNGLITCMPAMSHTGYCQTGLRYWPFDKENCTFYFSSFLETRDQMNLTVNGNIYTVEYVDGPGWKLLNVTYHMFDDEHQIFKIIFALKREAAGLAALVVTPSIVIVVLTLASHLLDVKDDKRLGLQCFCFFGHIIFLTEIGTDIPRHSLEAPVILLFVRDSMLLAFLSILLTVLTMSLRTREEQTPAWVQSICRWAHWGPGKYIMFTQIDDNSTNNLDDPQEQSSAATSWIMLVYVINSFIFVACCIVYIILLSTYLQREY